MRESALNREMFSMGLSPRHKGFYYLSRALCIAQDGSGADASEAIRATCGQSDARTAERCMRYAIRYAWEVGCGSIREAFPGLDLPPSPVEFVSALLWRIDEE